MENQNTNQNPEIDLSAIKQQFKGYFTKANDSFFDVILFIRRFIVAFILLLAVGIGLGIYLDTGSKLYLQKVFVTPNFGSVDYLYEETELMNAKLKEHDTLYLSKLGIKNIKNISKIEIRIIIR
jgi:hypothetical protein